MLTMTLKNDKKLLAAMTDIAKRQLPFAMSQTINDMLVVGRSAINEYQDKKYKGGSTDWSKRGIGYVKSTKYFLVGFIHSSNNPKHEYLKYGWQGGPVRPLLMAKQLKIPAHGRDLNKRGNFKFSGGTTFPKKMYQKSKESQSNFFQGVPANVEKMPFYKGPNPAHYEGVWERKGKGKERRIVMRLQYQDSRPQKPYLRNPQNPAISAIKKNFDRTFAKRLVNALRTAK